MDKFTIFKTEHWTVLHRKDSRYQGYLIVFSNEENIGDLSDLSKASLQELGLVLGKAEKLLKTVYEPYKVIFTKLGFICTTCHFHVIPVSYELLAEIKNYLSYEHIGHDVMKFVSDKYCVQELSNTELQTIYATVDKLRTFLDT